jgi:hypothetical protein
MYKVRYGKGKIAIEIRHNFKICKTHILGCCDHSTDESVTIAIFIEETENGIEE